MSILIFVILHVHVCVSEKDRNNVLFPLEEYGLLCQFLSTVTELGTTAGRI